MITTSSVLVKLIDQSIASVVWDLTFLFHFFFLSKKLLNNNNNNRTISLVGSEKRERRGEGGYINKNF